MSREGNLFKNTFILALGTFFPKFLTVLITPILTAQLTKAEYGQYDLVVTMVSLLFPLATLQISSAAFRFLIMKRNNREECTPIISTIYVFVLLTSLGTGIIFFGVLFNRLGWTGMLIAGYFVFDMMLVTTQQIVRGLGKNIIYSVSAIIQAVISVVFIALLTGIFGTPNLGLDGVIIALFLSTFLPTVFLQLKGGIYPYIKKTAVKKVVLKEMLAYSWPMVPNNLSLWVLNLSDRLVITAVLGIEANAVYAVANKLPSIFTSVQSTFIMAWQESASLASEDDDKAAYYSKMCDGVYRLLTGLMSGLIMCTPVIWRILIHGDYEAAYVQLPILYMGVMFSCMSSTLGGIYIAHMKTKSVGITSMCAAAINFIIDICFVSKIGIWAGSISTMVSYFWLWFYRMRGVQKFQELRINYKMIVSSIAILAVMAFCNYQQMLIFDLLNVVLCIIVLIVFDREIILGMFRKIMWKK